MGQEIPNSDRECPRTVHGRGMKALMASVTSTVSSNLNMSRSEQGKGREPSLSLPCSWLAARPPLALVAEAWQTLSN